MRYVHVIILAEKNTDAKVTNKSKLQTLGHAPHLNPRYGCYCFRRISGQVFCTPLHTVPSPGRAASHVSGGCGSRRTDGPAPFPVVSPLYRLQGPQGGRRVHAGCALRCHIHLRSSRLLQPALPVWRTWVERRRSGRSAAPSGWVPASHSEHRHTENKHKL